jgi:hypothetical protein
VTFDVVFRKVSGVRPEKLETSIKGITWKIKARASPREYTFIGERELTFFLNVTKSKTKALALTEPSLQR